MTATEYLRVYARFRLLIGVCVLAGLAVSFIISATSGTTYTSVARVHLVSNAKTENTSPEAYSTSLLAAQRVPTYADLAESSELSTRVLDDRDVDLTAEQLQERIEVRAPTNSTVITIVVRDDDRARTELIASRVSEALRDLIMESEDALNVKRPLLRTEAIDDDIAPVAAPSPPAWRNPLLGAAAGLVLGLAVAVVASRLDKRLHDEAAVRQVLTAPVLGTVPPAGATDSVLERAVREVRTAVFARHPGPGTGFTIAVTSPRPDGRVPEVFGAVAAALADTGAQTLLIDADLRSPHSTPLVGSAADGSPGLADYLAGTSSVEEILWQHSSSRCYVLPAGHDDPDPAAVLHSSAFLSLLADARDRYDFVLVMTPATSLGTDALAVAATCDRTLVSVTLARTTRPELQSALDQLARVDADVMGAVLLS